MKSAKKDEDNLKRKRKRLTIGWFFRPRGDWFFYNWIIVSLKYFGSFVWGK